MATSCVEYLDAFYLQQLLEFDWAAAEKATGEYIGRNLAERMLGHEKTGFVPAKFGLDGVFREKTATEEKGRLVLVEVKTSHKTDPLKLLGDEKDAPLMGSQMEEGWIRKAAERMMDHSSAYHANNPDNEILGREILETLTKPRGVDNFRLVLIHIDEETHGVDHYEVVNGRWERIMSHTGPEVEERLYGHGK